MYYQSRPFYVEIIYFDNKVNVDRRVFQGSMILTHSVQSFLDSIVSSYDHSEVFTGSYDFGKVFTGDPEEEVVWEVEGHVSAFENVLLLNITRLHII